ncbi:MAG TPA: CoB--CoM heterodisulfide reductase iron-sulfur subunit A family protein, partial [Desulfobacteraceae bacterium]|nr:CoB--CoM heterodisulfide reductase iron-sulfur subunit A family protein [Desulfobacteraceae bacterium]
CVGSRQPDRPYCSRVCCTHTIESTLELKRRNPEINVYVLYRDMRTYGEREELYNRAREQGVIFIRYDTDDKPVVTETGGKIEIEVRDPILGEKIRLNPDLLTLATAIVPSDESNLARLFKVAKDDSGFFIEAHAKLKPVDFATDGVFLCGLAHYPKSLDESIEQALAAAGRASACLAAEKVMVGGTVAEVDPACCSRCGMCVEICPFGAAGFTEQGHAAVNAALCKGCGLCTASCRSGALTLKCYDDSQIMAMIEQM